ncbi:MAG: hypothetical protein KY476_05305 [Planctomycetes bacterium]|nr:hypothetical protein [Planctomycetota bacterium]
MRLRALTIAAGAPDLASLVRLLEAGGCAGPVLRSVSTAAAALALLKDECFDCIAIVSEADGTDAIEAAQRWLDIVRAIRAAGSDDPVLLVTARADDRLWCDALAADCEILVTGQPWESPALAAVIARLARRHEIGRDQRRLELSHERRLSRDRDEAEHLLARQRRIIAELQGAGGGTAGVLDGRTTLSHRESVPLARPVLPPGLHEHYHELLRTYVIMGSGSLVAEIGRVAESMAAAALTPAQALEFHLERVETLVRGLGNRSARHVLARADLLALELIVRLGECYQSRWLAGRTAAPFAPPLARPAA